MVEGQNRARRAQNWFTDRVAARDARTAGGTCDASFPLRPFRDSDTGTMVRCVRDPPQKMPGPGRAGEKAGKGSERTVRAILGRRQKQGHLLWYVVWLGYPRGDAAWQPRASFVDVLPDGTDGEATTAWVQFEAAHPGTHDVKVPRKRPRKY